MDRTFAVIMAGGVGSRFWPESRSRRPKQLLDLTGEGQPLIASTLARLAPLIPLENILVVTARPMAEGVQAALPGLPAANILIEPQGRNTAPCIGWAALEVRRRDPGAVLAVLPADHLVAGVARFRDVLALALDEASGGEIVTVGITPDQPETGFGYIEIGAALRPGVHTATRFVEKPDRATAERYLASGCYAWNSGMFFFTAQRMLDEIARQMPELARGLGDIAAALGTPDEAATLERVYPTLPSQSIDYGVMEGAQGVRIVPSGAIGWSDVGSWSAAFDCSPRDGADNALPADAVAVGATGCLARVPAGKLIALVGVRDLVVVDTGDALLVCARDAAQDVKQVVDGLARAGRAGLL